MSFGRTPSSRRVVAVALVATLVMFVGRSARAQALLRTQFGDTGQFGASVANAGDLDADGVDDYLVGEPWYRVYLQGWGRVQLYSGASGARLRTHLAANYDQEFGSALASVGDLDGDGVADYVIGAPSSYTFSSGSVGMAAAFSGATGTELWRAWGVYRWRFGAAVAAIGDVDGDGAPDVLVGGPNGSIVYVLASDGTLLYDVVGQAAGSQAGASLAGLGDLDGDGVRDFAVGEPRYYRKKTGQSEVGRVRIHSGASGAVLSTSYGDAAYDQYGWSLARCGDLDGDSYDDLLVGTPYADLGAGARSGMVRVMSSAQNVEIRTHAGAAAGDDFGRWVAGIGDFDLDGVADYLCCAPFANGLSGQVEVHSGADGARRWTSDGASGATFGVAATAGEFNGDGIADWIIGAPWDIDPATGDSGAARLFVGCPPHARGYGAGWPGTLGIPALDCTVPPAIGDRGEIRVGNSGTGTTAALLFVGFDEASLPTGAGGTLLVQPALALPFAIAGSDLLLGCDLPDDEALCFLALYVQAIEADPGASRGLSFTAGQELTIGLDFE